MFYLLQKPALLAFRLLLRFCKDSVRSLHLIQINNIKKIKNHSKGSLKTDFRLP
ncbi:hypothetical protein GCWU000324_00150 [Kingella oralis ATCC 51147]|uniref:Uncharacterized protein n=1 Tax=Kingella oralis ATCC 51147 TaxID=629741 RepID=C4GER3_9NEIS|nr:hypothetical protein GCWU000324_00150 [Kingella oralis ATCC 51147]